MQMPTECSRQSKRRCLVVMPRTTGVRRHPRRKPSRLKNKITVLIRWNCTAASCNGAPSRSLIISLAAQHLTTKAGTSECTTRSAAHPVGLWGEEARDDQIQTKCDSAGRQLRHCRMTCKAVIHMHTNGVCNYT